MTGGLCRDCFAAVEGDGRRCGHCASPRVVRHPELHGLAIAHLDCDAFYAAVEKRDNPALRDRPVIVGGGKRGVVAACCYISRTYGVRSAMPMFKARTACPDAVVIRPDMKKYAAVGGEVRALMRALTPLVEPLSIDEAFLDLSGTERLHGASPGVTLARLCRRIEDEIGVTASIGLSYNKFLAKIASDLDKPRGFAVLGRADAPAFLARQPVSRIWGVGPALERRLAKDGLHMIGDLAALDERALVARYGGIGVRLARFARGEDDRKVTPDRPAKSISAETTFEQDLSDAQALGRCLWPLCETVSARLKGADLAGETITLKLRTADFRIHTRARRLPVPTQLAEAIYQAARPLLAAACDGRPFRLIGVGVSRLGSAGGDRGALFDRLDPASVRQAQVEHALDRLRASFGDAAVVKGRAWLPGGPPRDRGGRSR